MKRFLCVLGLAALSLTWEGSAFATDFQTYLNLLAKVAPSEGSLFANFKPKLACACVSNPKLGVVFQDGSGNINCADPFFNPDGSLSLLNPCNGDFVVLN